MGVCFGIPATVDAYGRPVDAYGRPQRPQR
jgi:hypothetical protein